MASFSSTSLVVDIRTTVVLVFKAPFCVFLVSPTQPPNHPTQLVINFGPAASGASSSDRGAEPQHETDLWNVLVAVVADEPGKTNCHCGTAPVEELAVRRFPITREDADSKEHRYSAVRFRGQDGTERGSERQSDIYEYVYFCTGGLLDSFTQYVCGTT